MKITDQVIEEVDEQMTITSTRQPDTRPTVQSIFQQSPLHASSEPVNVPSVRPTDYTRTQSYVTHGDPLFIYPNDDRGFLSSSAPVTGDKMTTPTGERYGFSITDFEQGQPNSNDIKGTQPRNGKQINNLFN